MVKRGSSRGTEPEATAGGRSRGRPTLADVKPALAAEWHPTKNGALGPSDVTAHSTRKVWWCCEAAPDHVWKAVISSRTAGNGCPFCAGRRTSSTNSLALLAPAVAAQWHPTKNGTLRASDVPVSSGRSVWWKCSAGPDHEWQVAVCNRTGGNGCPFCGGQRVSVTTSLAHLAPDVAAEWHPTKNGELTPAKVTTGSDRICWWRCTKDPSHEWRNCISNRVKKRQMCPFCSGHKVTRETSLGVLYPAISAQWHPDKNEGLTPYDVRPRSGCSVWWKCPQGPDHEWSSPVHVRTNPRSQGCPFCTSHRVSIDNCLLTCVPEVARTWHPTLNGELTPRDVMPCSNKRAWWQCDFGHVWLATVASRAGKKRHGCPVCARGRPRKTATTSKRRETVRLAKHEGASHGPGRREK